MQFHTALFQQHAIVVVIIQALYLIRQSFSTALPSNLIKKTIPGSSPFSLVLLLSIMEAKAN